MTAGQAEGQCPDAEARRTRVVLLISGLMYGGGQKVVLDLLQGLQRRGGTDSELTILGCREPVMRQAATHVVPYDGRYNRPSTLVSTAWRLRAQLAGDHPAILHSHGWDADVIGWLALLGSRSRQIIHLHPTPEWLASARFRHRARRFLTRLAFARKGTRVIAVSEATRTYWAQHLPWRGKSIAIVHNGVDIGHYNETRALERLAPRPRTIGVAARLSPMKGIEYLLDATAKLAADHPDIRLRIAGDGNLKEDLQQKARDLGVSQNVEFLGHVEDMKPFYGSIDVFALPSVSTEGLPLAVLEAMASAVPVVATTVGGTPEIVRHGQDGFLVPPRDSDALADALRQLLTADATRQGMAASARQRVREEFLMDAFVGRILGLYVEAA